ncbi:P-II family nitrogen regulator [Thiomicrorhabdus indica]|uniref:P-II family nitrogen regulator n=1 Tax=Thiomicrorhabdus indica TaxID=2267253 RepID=UPI002AA6E2D4|nr:hypothetical protein [Thiomicrorhabdus indica]
MPQMQQGKAVHIIVNSTFERELIKVLKEAGATGYTQLDARGFGYSGVQDGHSEGESNVLFIVLVTDEKAQVIEKKLVSYINRGYPIVSYITDANVLTNNRYNKPTL